MPEVLVATPLQYSAVRQPYSFKNDISIRELGPILWDLSIVKSFVSENERNELASVRYWLCATKETVHYPYGSEGDELYEKAEHAASALQILCPSGAKNIFLKLLATEQGYDNVGSHRPRELCSTLVGRIISLEEMGLAQDFDVVYAGVARAFSEKLVRLQNPILLLEHAQQTGNVHLSTLMSVMALDMLFMAGEKQPFIERLGGFLGLHAYVFPKDALRRQPQVAVGDVIGALYEFRNTVAHGREVPSTPYRKMYDLLDGAGNRINAQDYYDVELMLESGLFMLAAALRKVFVEGWFDDVADAARWRAQLRACEHRYKNTTRRTP